MFRSAHTHIGRDCVGALQLLPETEDADVQRIKATPVTESQIETILQNYRTMPLGVDMEADFRISIAGAQEKTAFLFYANQWHRPQGATPTSHLFKLPIGELGQSGIDLSESVENEWLCHKLLKAFGLPIAKVEMASFGNQKVLVVERFDRKWAADGSWLNECCDLVDTALNKVGAELPVSFPHAITEPIFSGLASARNRLVIESK